jgi:methylase of polypeptide subunit release factors
VDKAEPFTVADVCCGSGVMLLAAAKQFPRWSIDSGLVQFYGVDIDPLCVEMCRLNMLNTTKDFLKKGLPGPRLLPEA